MGGQLVELHDGHQLQGGHAEVLQVRDLLDDPPEGARVPDPRAAVPREPAHVRLVDDAEAQRVVERLVALPVEIVRDHDAPGRAGRAPGDSLHVGVEQQPAGIEPVALLGLAGPVDPVADRSAPGPIPSTCDMPHVACPVVHAGRRRSRRTGKLSRRLVEQEQRDGRRVPAERGELGPRRVRGRPEGEGPARGCGEGAGKGCGGGDGVLQVPERCNCTPRRHRRSRNTAAASPAGVHRRPWPCRQPG